MDDKNVKAISLLLGIDEKTVKDATADGGAGLDSLIADFKKDKHIWTISDVAKLKENVKKDVLDNLTETDIPDSFKAKSVGWKMGDLETKIKEKYAFDGEHKGLLDLVDTIVNKAKNNKDGDSTLVDENKRLKEQIVKLGEEKENEVKTIKSNFDSQLVKHDLNNALKGIDLDIEDGDAKTKQMNVLKMSFLGSHSLQRKGDVTVIVDKDGKVLEDKKLDPITLKEGITTFANDYGFQLKQSDEGGQGGSSSKKKTTVPTGQSFSEYRESKGIRANTEEADVAFAEWKKMQPAD